MFPYADQMHAYWTGYYTSWPVGKGLFRDLSRLSHIMDSKDAIALLGDEPNEKIIQRAAERNRAIGVL